MGGKGKIFILVGLIVFDFTCELGSGTIIGSEGQNCNGSDCTYVLSAQFAGCNSLRLAQIPPQCSSAVYLDMRKNDLQYLDETSLTGFQQLRYVYLDGNQIRNITPGAFAQCPKIRAVYLQNNEIGVVHSQVFSGLRDLRYLYLNSAEVQRIQSGAFSGLLALQRLYLSDNFIRTIPHDLFHDLSNLQILTLANNRIQTLASDTFDGLANLLYLDIKFNRLTTIPSGLFRNLFLLKSLIVSYNSINTIEEGAIDLEELPYLDLLDMRNNSLHTVEHMSSSRNPPQNVNLHFAGNPIHCNCHAKWLLKWYQLNSGSPRANESGAVVICQGPQALVDQPILNISNDQLMCKPGDINTVSRQTVSPRSSIKLGSLYDIDFPPDQYNQPPISITCISEYQKTTPDIEYIARFIIGLVAACAMVIATCLGLFYLCHKEEKDSVKTKQSNPRPHPPPDLKLHLKINPLTDGEIAEEEDDEGVAMDEGNEAEHVSPNLNSPLHHPSSPSPPYQSSLSQSHHLPFSGFVTAGELPLHHSRPVLCHSVSTPTDVKEAANLRTRSSSQPSSLTPYNQPNVQMPPPPPYHEISPACIWCKLPSLTINLNPSEIDTFDDPQTPSKLELV